MTIFSLDDIRKRVDDLSAKISAPDSLLPTYGYSKDFAYPHIEVDKAGLMHFVVMERGQEIERKTTDDLDTLLYWIFSGVTFSMACSYEVKHRIENEDCRRIIFKKQEEWLCILSNAWQEREANEHKAILRRYPFDDLAGVRAAYCAQLRKQNYSEDKIKELAYEKYPVN